jgi:hypothetical protein
VPASRTGVGVTKEPTYGKLTFVCEALYGYWGSEVLEMHTTCKGKRDVEGPFIHTTLLECSGLETDSPANGLRIVTVKLYSASSVAKPPGVVASSQRGKPGVFGVLHHTVFRMTAA